MPWSSVNAVDLFYTDEGEGLPILLVHGWGCDSNDWVFQIDRLATTYRVVAVDLRGHGRSTARAAGGNTVAQYARDLAGLLSNLGIDSAVVMGHSLGGVVATVLAVEYPELVRAVVNVDPSYATSAATEAIVAALISELGTAVGNAIAASSVAELEVHAPEWLRTWHRRRLLGVDPVVLRESYEDLYFGPNQVALVEQSAAYLAGRRCPALSFHGNPTKAAWERNLVGRDGSTVVEWSDVGHWLHQERSAEFNDITMNWLSTLSVDAATPSDRPRA